MTREDCNQPFWKEKVVAGLPTMFSEKIRTKLRNQNNSGIPYDRLTSGDLVNIIHEGGLLLCSDLRLKQQIKKEQLNSKKRLRNFCKQFGLEPLKTQKPKKSKKLCKDYYKERSFKEKLKSLAKGKKTKLSQYNPKSPVGLGQKHHHQFVTSVEEWDILVETVR